MLLFRKYKKRHAEFISASLDNAYLSLWERVKVRASIIKKHVMLNLFQHLLLLQEILKRVQDDVLYLFKNIKSFISITCFTLLLSSCGFTPVYKTLDEGSTAAKNLATIKVESSHDLLGQFFSSRLSDLLNPDAIDTEAKYRLETTLTKNKIPFAIQQDRTITRYKVSIDAAYKITDIATGKVIDSGVLRRDGGYDKVDSDYASYISDEDTTKRIAKELAEDVRVKMIALLVEGR